MNEVILRLPDPDDPSKSSTAAPLGGRAAAPLLLDVDAGQDGARARLEIQANRVSLVVGAQRILLPATWPLLDRPHVRSIPGHGSFLFDSIPQGVESAWFFDSAGRLQKTLELTGALDATALHSGFAVGFHPGGAEANGLVPSALAESAGISFFDGTGELVFSLNERLRNRRMEAHNILAMAAFSPTQLIFIPESMWQGERVRDCPVVIYDWTRDELRWWVSPFLDPLAVSGSATEKAAFVFSPIGYDDQLFRLDLETLATESVGACADIYRGLDQGLFLAQIDDSTFTVVDPSAPSELFQASTAQVLGSGGPGGTPTSGPTGAPSGSLKNGGLKGRLSRARLEIVR